MPLPTPGSVLWAHWLTWPSMSASTLVDEDTEGFCPIIAQQVALLLQYPNQVTDCYPWSSALEVISSPASCSFTQPMCPHLPNKQAEGHGAEGIYKSKCITSCYSSVFYRQSFHMADSQIGPTCKSVLFLMIFWSLICMEIDSKRTCFKMLLVLR